MDLERLLSSSVSSMRQPENSRRTARAVLSFTIPSYVERKKFWLRSNSHSSRPLAPRWLLQEVCNLP
ncbi:hypothetical protein VTO42DRAFT_5040 [Malbranchea cinnamomea]